MVVARLHRFAGAIAAFGAVAAVALGPACGSAENVAATELDGGGDGASFDARRESTDAQPSDASGADAGGPGLTSDFRAWLTQNRYDAGKLARDDLGGQSFGGREVAGEPIQNEPVIFVHGNSDAAWGVAGQASLTGWVASRAAFERAGYRSRELYATTWGPADLAQVASQTHSAATLAHLRDFVEAVLAYTGAPKVDVIAHSMGVTLMRKVILGGPVSVEPGDAAADLGAPLTARVDAFVGIAGGNLGLASCFGLSLTAPTCSAVSGFYPGVFAAGMVTARSKLLQDLLDNPHTEGAFVGSIWSTADQVIGAGGLVYGSFTSRVPSQDIEHAPAGFGHIELKDQTAPVQLALVRDHALPPP